MYPNSTSYRKRENARSINLLNELKECQNFSKNSKIYTKLFLNKKIDEVIRHIANIKNIETPEMQSDNKPQKKPPKIKMPFNISKFKKYLDAETAKLNSKINYKKIMREKYEKSSAIKKIRDMTKINVENYRLLHPEIPPTIGSYSPNYDAIYKKPQVTIFHEKGNLDTNLFLNNNIKRSRLKTENLMPRSNKNFFNTDISNENVKYKKKLLSQISVSSIQYPSIVTNYITKQKNNDYNYKTINPNNYTNSNKFIHPLATETISNKSFNNNSINSISNTNRRIQRINKILQQNKNKSDLNSTENIYINNKNKNLNKTHKKLIEKEHSLKKIASAIDKPSPPSIGFYSPKYDYVKETIPKISFDKHTNKKEGSSYKKYLLRKIMTKYDVDENYELIKTLNNKKIVKKKEFI